MIKDIRIRIKWLGVCALLIILICGLSFSYAVYAKQVLRENEENISLRSITAQQAQVDNTFNDLFDYSLALVGGVIPKSLEQAETLEDFRALQAMKLSKEIGNHILFNPIIDDIYFFYPNADIVVGKQGVYLAHTYWASIYGVYENVPFDQWYRELFQSRENGYFSMMGKGDRFLYSRLGVQNSDTRLVITKLNMQALEAQLGWITADTQNAFSALIDENGYVLASTGNKQQFMDPATHQVLSIGSEYITTTLDSSVVELQYFTAVTKSSAYRTSDTITKIALVFLLAAVLGSTIIAYFLVRKSTAPLEKIVATLPHNADKHGDEFVQIHLAIEEMLSSQSALELVSKQQQITICQSFFNELLRQDPNDKKNPELIAAIYGIVLEKPNYCTVVRRRNSEACKSNIQNMLIALDEDMLVSWTYFEDVDLFLLNYDAEETDYRAELIAQLESLSDKPAEIAVSNVVDTALLIMDCWKQCAEKLNCLHLLPKVYRQKTAYHTDPVSTILEQLRQRLDIFDFEYARNMAADIFKLYVYDTDPFYFAYKKYHVIHILLPYVPTEGKPTLIKLAESTEQNEWASYFKDAIFYCEAHLGQRGQASCNHVAVRVHSIIEQQYNNPMLDLRMLAEETTFSQSHLSKLFKERYGISIYQYINQVRIRRAKEMIISGDAPIKEIALAVGFSGDAQFIRAFKQAEGITPGNLRKNDNRKS